MVDRGNFSRGIDSRPKRLSKPKLRKKIQKIFQSTRVKSRERVSPKVKSRHSTRAAARTHFPLTPRRVTGQPTHPSGLFFRRRRFLCFFRRALRVLSFFPLVDLRAEFLRRRHSGEQHFVHPEVAVNFLQRDSGRVGQGL
jgi:hypothetical protein